MNNERMLNLIGLAMRSRKVTLGQDAVFAKLPNENLKMIFLASDAGNNTKKKVHDKAKTYNATLVDQFSSEELSKAIGKENRRVLLVTDKGFINKFKEYLYS